MPHECFADEIAIDFPSLEPAVERMRESFLGEQTGAELGDVVRLDLQVTRRDVWEGASVPVEVPMRGVCRRCGGRGAPPGAGVPGRGPPSRSSGWRLPPAPSVRNPLRPKPVRRGRYPLLPG